MLDQLMRAGKRMMGNHRKHVMPNMAVLAVHQLLHLAARHLGKVQFGRGQPLIHGLSAFVSKQTAVATVKHKFTTTRNWIASMIPLQA